MFLVPPPARMSGVDRSGHLFKRWDCPALALFIERIAAGLGYRAQVPSGFAGISQRDRIRAAQPKVPSPAVHREAENPRGCPVGFDEKVEACAIEMPTRLALADQRRDLLCI